MVFARAELVLIAVGRGRFAVEALLALESTWIFGVAESCASDVSDELGCGVISVDVCREIVEALRTQILKSKGFSIAGLLPGWLISGRSPFICVR